MMGPQHPLNQPEKTWLGWTWTADGKAGIAETEEKALDQMEALLRRSRRNEQC